MKEKDILTYWICESVVNISGEYAELLAKYLVEKFQKYSPKIQVTIIQCENCGSKEIDFYDVKKNLGTVEYSVKCKQCGCTGKVKEEWSLQ